MEVRTHTLLYLTSEINKKVKKNATTVFFISFSFLPRLVHARLLQAHVDGEPGPATNPGRHPHLNPTRGRRPPVGHGGKVTAVAVHQRRVHEVAFGVGGRVVDGDVVGRAVGRS